MIHNPKNILLNGVKILSVYLEPLNFKFQLLETGKSSGGEFASGQFVCGEKVIELHYRFSLGLVKYKIDNLELSHEEYIKLLDRVNESKYPNFSDNSMDAFNCLKHDLECLLTDFTENDDEIFKQKAPERLKELEQKENFERNEKLKRNSGDQKLINEAKVEIKKGNYS